MTKHISDIIGESPMRTRTESYISKEPYLATTIKLGFSARFKKELAPTEPKKLHQQFEKYLPEITIRDEKSSLYLFKDGNINGNLIFQPAEYRHSTENPDTFKCWDKVVLTWQPKNEIPSELIKILKEFEFKIE